jgi:ClpP class serine protease
MTDKNLEWEWKRKMKEETMAKRAHIIAVMEKERKSKVITMVHRKEPWQTSAEEPSIAIEDTESVLLQIKRTDPKMPIDFVIHTPGGIALAAEMIAMALKQHDGKVTVHIPFYAMSGGSLIALAADEIRMEHFSVMGPLDPQIDGLPANSLASLLDRKPIETMESQMVVMADISKMAVVEMKNFIIWLLKGRMKAKQAKSLAEYLTGGYLNHDEPLSFEVLKGFGLPVELGVPDIVYDLFDTMSHGDCMRPGHTAHKKVQ